MLPEHIEVVPLMPVGAVASIPIATVAQVVYVLPPHTLRTQYVVATVGLTLIVDAVPVIAPVPQTVPVPHW